MIQLVEVCKRFGLVSALRDITLHVHPGEFILLSGPSGAGKTTLLRTIFAAELPDAGQVLVADQDLSRASRRQIAALRRSMGMVFQDFRLLPQRTALANVAIVLEIRGLAPAQVRSRSLLALSAVGLEERADVRAGNLSGGEQQRVAVARALVGSPRILLADEPTGNLDPERSHDVLDLLELEARRGTTVVVATHDPMVVEQAAADRIVLVDHGTVVSVSRSAIGSSELRPAIGRDASSGVSNPRRVEVPG